MTVVRDATSALQNGASTMLSTMRRNKITRRLLPERTQKVMKRLNRSIQPRRPRTLPLVLAAVGVSLAATLTGILVSRYVLSRAMDEEAAESVGGPAVAEEPVVVG